MCWKGMSGQCEAKDMLRKKGEAPALFNQGFPYYALNLAIHPVFYFSCHFLPKLSWIIQEAIHLNMSFNILQYCSRFFFVVLFTVFLCEFLFFIPLLLLFWFFISLFSVYLFNNFFFFFYLLFRHANLFKSLSISLLKKFKTYIFKL